MPNGEEWSTGFWVMGDTPTSAGEANALAELAYDEFGAEDDSGGMTETLLNVMNSATSWLTTKAYCYPTGGPTATFIGSYDTPTARVGAAVNHNPNQVAIVLTTRTGLAGRSHRGRMYLPATGAPLETDGQLAQVILGYLTDAWALAFTDWNAASDGKIVVVSAHLGTATQVSSVTMDSRFDIQRSRAKSEAILRTSVGVVTP